MAFDLSFRYLGLVWARFLGFTELAGWLWHLDLTPVGTMTLEGECKE